MFHVKQQKLGWRDLWDPQTTPYSTKIYERLTYPWELLQAPHFGELLSAASQGIKSIKYHGLTDRDYLLIEGELVSGKIVATGFAAKGELRLKLDGVEVKGASLIQAGVYIQAGEPITIAAGSFVQFGAYLEGPTHLGQGCEVRQGAYVRGNVLAGKRCIIGHSSELKGVIMHDHAKAPHFAYVGDSILGAEVNLGAGTKVSNLKISGEPIVIKEGEQIYNTQMRKLGAILGDKVETGCNSVLNPGVICFSGCVVYPAMALRPGLYPPKSWIKASN